ncbi:hypothetical protein PHSY_000875 [Pseudozyma hubeiensis SY62]|uniref:Transmembrane mucin involved in surface sensing via MAP-kinase cascade n=1 Tax=Pseudozyma hubeiensis (strain SY62) TaxID=1305764 RepID=R9P5E4_PSEHS|nr:hypothetical protein PHSY_000875 [Pseudozyma hubeiensis SY62]GAC93310.1 hypothetical protein PHSY_000875 [Pseudozyma hubeiensis SY62]
MVFFRPPFQLMLVSLNLVLLLALQSSSALADGLHPNHGPAHADNAVRRHAARAGRLSKRFPPVSGLSDDRASAAKRDRHARDHHRYGLTPAEIADLLAEQQIEDSGLDEPSFHAFNVTNTTSTSHHHSRTRTASDSQDPTSTGSMSRFALPTSNSTSPSPTTSSSLAAASATSSSLHASSSSSDDGGSSSASSPSTTADDGFQNTFSKHRHHSHTSSSAAPAAPTSSSGSDNISSTNSTGTETNETDNGDGLGGLLGGILGAPSASSSGASRSDSAFSTSSSSGSSSVNGGLLGNLLGGSSTSSASAAHSTAGSQDDAPSATSSSSAASATSSSEDPDSGDDDTPPSSSKHTQSTQPDFYSFTPQATRSSSRTSSTPTASGLLQGLLPQLIPSSSSSSNAATATPFPTSSPSTSDGSGSGSDSGTTSTNDSASSSTSDGSEGGSATTASTATSQTTATVTTGPSSTSQNTGAVPTGTGSGGDADSSGSGSDPSSVQPPSSSASRSTASSSSPDDSGSASSASSSSSATTNPYWYANTKSLNMAPSSTSSADQPAETGTQSTSDSDSDASSGATSSASSDGVGTSPAAQDLPTTIVPSADSYNQPANTTSIGLLFKPDMKWTWVISQADLTAQIFAFMPDLVGQSAGLESSKVSTVKLAGYSTEANDTATPASLSTARTLYMAYVPSSSVEDIQAMIANTSSPFYTSAAEGAPQQLASQVDPTFNILSVVGQVAAGAKQNAKASSGTSKDDSTTRNSLIGVGCGLAGCFALVAGGMLYRKQRKNKEADGADGNAGGVSRAHTIRSFHGGLRETWAPEAMDQHLAFDTAGEMQQVWSPQGIGMAMGHPEQAAAYPHEDGFGGYVVPDPFHDAAGVGAGAAGGYVNMNRSSRMTERSAYSDLSQMTEAQRIQYDYESSRRSFQSTSDHSGSQGAHSEHSMHSGNSAGMLSTYQEDYRVPRQHTTNHAFGERSNNTRSRRRGSVASSTIGRPEMMSNSVLL